MFRLIYFAEEEARDHRDPSGVQIFADIVNIFWSLLVLAVIFLIVIPFRAARWLVGGGWRSRGKHEEKRNSEQEPDVWRYGYH